MPKSIAQCVVAFTFLSSFGLLGCGPHKALESASAEVASFHVRYNREQYESIHAAADPGLRARMAPAEWVQKLASSREKLGLVKGTEQREWHHSTLGTDTLLVTTYRTAFEKATATETFTFRTVSARASLLAYSIESPVLNAK